LGFAAVPTAGDIYLEGRLVTGLTPPERARLRAEYIGQIGPFAPAMPPAERLAAIQQAVGRQILLAEQPLNGLDPAGAGAPVLDLLRQLNRDGLTILMTTSDPETAVYGNRLYRMSDGILIAIMEG
jgi:ABC-type lipoprotein export system ATPase subunit